ncbi:MAG: WD40 repeat domain-containing protein [Verrucomicrobiales bacterium]|nr:WD40 repeat domain-containing protein [Verrucomicrobiales bacterium]
MSRFLPVLVIAVTAPFLPAANFVVQHPHYFGIDCLALSEDSSFIATANSRGEVKVWDTRSGYLLQTLFTSAHQSETLRFDSTQQYLGLEQMGGAGTVWEWRTGRIVETSDKSNIVALDFIPKTESCLILQKDGSLKRIASKTGHSEWTVKSPHPTQSVRCLSEVEAMLIGFKGVITTVDLNTGTITTTLTPATGASKLPDVYFSLSVDQKNRTLWMGGHSGLFRASIPSTGGKTYPLQQVHEKACFSISSVPEKGIANAEGIGKLTVRNTNGEKEGYLDQVRNNAAFSSDHVVWAEQGRWILAAREGLNIGHVLMESRSPINYGNPFLESRLSLRIAYDKSNHSMAFLNRKGELFSITLAPEFGCKKFSTRLPKVPTESQISYLTPDQLILLTERNMIAFQQSSGSILSTKELEGVWDRWALRGHPNVAIRTKEKECITYRWTGKEFAITGRFPTPFGQAVSLNRDGTKGVVFRDNSSTSEIEIYDLGRGTSRTYSIGKGMNIGGSEIFFLPPDESKLLISTDKSWKHLDLTTGEVFELKTSSNLNEDLRNQWDPQPVPGHDDLAICYETGFDGSFSVVNTATGHEKWKASRWNDHEKIHRHHLLGFSPNTKGIWSCGADGRPFLWDLREGSPKLRLSLCEEKSSATLETPQGNYHSTNYSSNEIIQVSYEADGSATCLPVDPRTDPSPDIQALLHRYGYKD